MASNIKYSFNGDRSVIELTDAILAINNEASFEEGGDIDNITWLNGTTPVAKADILAKQTELQTAYDAQSYARSRKEEYPAIVDQLDDIFHNGIDGWKATIQVTKDKYPKE